jgi:hypothetical protein
MRTAAGIWILATALVAGAAPASRGHLESPVEFPLPEGIDPAKPLRLIRASDLKELPVQIVPGDPRAAVWVHFQNLHPEGKEQYRLQQVAPRDFPNMECADDGKSLVVSSGAKKILQYNYGVVSTPGTDPVFDRSGFIHPLWTPQGKIITNNSPANHLHHPGIWSAWTSSEFDGRKSNFWESKEKQGKVECVKVEQKFAGPVCAGFRARHWFINLNGPAGPVPVLDEVWDVRIYTVGSGQDLEFFIDLVSTQSCLTDKPLVIREYRYGGIGFRGSKDWEGKDGVAFLTSEQKSRINGHATKAKWVEAAGKVDGTPAAIAFFGHPSNFRAPQPLRIHPDEPFFNWAVPQGGDFSIEPGKPYTARYRFIVSAVSSGVLDDLWQCYAGKSNAELVLAK